MKKLYIGIFFLPLLFSGCLWRKKETKIPPYVIEADQDRSLEKDKKVKRLFVSEGEELEPFIIEEDQIFDEQGYPVLQLKEEETVKGLGERPTNQKVILKTIYFDFGSSEIRPDQKPILDENVEKIGQLVKEGKKVTVEGHACKYAGSREYNMALSHDRAQAIAEYLIRHGIPADAIKTVGRGFEMCLVEDDDMEAQAVNRRVEFYVED